jgi:hypothetical protein
MIWSKGSELLGYLLIEWESGVFCGSDLILTLRINRYWVGYAKKEVQPLFYVD